MYVDIDLETKSPADLKSVGAFKYSLDCQILCLAWEDSEDIGVEVTDDYDSMKSLLLHFIESGYIFRAHNMSFEWCVIKHQLGIELPIERCRCSLALALYHNLPGSLGAACNMLGLTAEKSDSGRKLMLKMCKDGYEATAEEHKELQNYCMSDVLAEHALFDRLGELPVNEQKVWEVDFKANYVTGVKVDVELCKKATKLFEETKKDINSECEKLYGFKLTQVAKVKDFCGLEDTKAETIRDALETEKDEEKLKVLKWRTIVSNTTPTKYKAVINREVNGRVYGILQYSGASQTHRFAGRGLQPQNFSRGSFSEDWIDEEMELFCQAIKNGKTHELISAGLASDPVDVLKSAIRGIFLGPMAVSDYEQIEARVLPWLAGDEALLKVFEDGTDLYKYTASQIYRKKIEDVTKDERFIGKIATLALGYAGGKGAFLGMASVYGIKDMTEEFAEEIKKKWRDANRRIVQLWYSLEEKCKDTVMYGKENRVGKLTVKLEEDFLRIYLPSGNYISYYKPQVDNGKLTFLKAVGPTDRFTDGWSAFSTKMGRAETYSGKLVENVTQAVARDVLAEAIVNVDEFAFSVHDEVISYGSLEKLEEAMLDKPKWAEGLPIGVDSFTAGRYRK